MTEQPKVARAELVGVFGYPVDENPTGIMQEAAFAAQGLHWRYITILVRPGDLADAMAGLRAMNFQYNSIGAGMTVCDVIPNPPRTRFLQEAEARGARTLDGLGMLVYQGAIAFEMWTGVEAPVEVMHQALAEVFGA